MSDTVLDTGTAPEEAAAAAPAEAGVGASLLDTAAPAAEGTQEGAAAAAEALGFDAIPESFRVMEGDQMNYAASAEALAKAYAERAAFGDVPEAYTPPEGLEENWDEVKELPAVKKFAEDAKALGMTDKQFSFALKHIGEAERDGRNYAITHGREQAEAKLREVWANPEEFQANLQQASHAVRLLVPEAERGEFGARYGNDPVILQVLARIGGEISEDAGVGNSAPVPTGEDVQSLMRSEAYQNSAHPDHKSTHAKVQRYYEKNYGTAPVL